MAERFQDELFSISVSPSAPTPSNKACLEFLSPPPPVKKHHSSTERISILLVYRAVHKLCAFSDLRRCTCCETIFCLLTSWNVGPKQPSVSCYDVKNTVSYPDVCRWRSWSRAGPPRVGERRWTAVKLSTHISSNVISHVTYVSYEH